MKLDTIASHDTIEGYPTRHYRITSEFTATPVATAITRRTILDVWTADLPFTIVNPWDRSPRTPTPATDNLKALQILQWGERRKIAGTPIKIIYTAPENSANQGVLNSIFDSDGATIPSTTATLSIYGIKPIDVPDTTFQLPKGYTKTAAGGRGPGG